MLDPAGSSANPTHNLCNHLAELDCEVHVFTAPHWLRVVCGSSKNAYHQHIVFYRGTQIRSYEAGTAAAKLFWRILRLWQHVWALFAICQEARQFDVIHTQILPVPLLDYLALRWMARRTPIVCTVHELVPHGAKFRRFSGQMFKSIYRLARVLFVFTDYTRDRLVNEYGITPDKIVKTPHGNAEHMLELKPDPELRPGPELGPDSSSGLVAQTPVILFIGGIRPDKGLDVLIEAARHLREKVTNFKVQIAGIPGFDLTGIRNSVVEFGLQDVVEFRLGFLQESEFVAYLSGATVVALPYRRIEQSGIAIAACTFGKAIVATRCGGLEELVNEAGNGLLVAIDDAVGFAEALATLLLDEPKRRLCELHSAHYASRTLSWHPIALKTIAGYRRAAEPASRLGQHAAAEQHEA
jgi:glycosyltransferase involved in cell wall biosynthesis